ncbi:hypothetical protein EG68_03786 [Paragonimus skrjabini miyazakii]|uniref:Uncharacterized protein n=1 Tax=Paragonimus skrjabini miyazakii TaxID=59628 RepID=A0A8S9Z5U7_9TREM|nr:hypothetical protein EG68_03786 [Paragonimus skrjabini miyazakii]
MRQATLQVSYTMKIISTVLGVNRMQMLERGRAYLKLSKYTAKFGQNLQEYRQQSPICQESAAHSNVMVIGILLTHWWRHTSKHSCMLRRPSS